MDRISLSLGSGGKLMRDFLREGVLKHFGNEYLNKLADSTHIELSGKIGFTTDSFVITPLFFPGGDIGRLSVAGTVNDLVVSGIRPGFLSLSLIIEEGFPVNDLELIFRSIKKALQEAGVEIVTGDTKVVRKGEADGIYINTAGIGKVIAEPAELNNGDPIVITGSPGDHSVAIMVARGEFTFDGEDIKSDCQPLNDLLPLWGRGVKWMRDITRGGLATILCELAEAESVAVSIEESDVPFSPPVRAASEILGIDPFYLASEGKAVLVVAPKSADEILRYLKTLEYGKESRIIGKIGGIGKNGELVLKTISGGLRIMEPLTGELLPRIC